MPSCTIARELDGGLPVLRIGGVFDAKGAWALREHLERDDAAQLLLDFSLVREFSDLGVAVLANGLQESGREVRFRGLRQHQLRIFRYCGLRLEDPAADGVLAAASPSASA